ncbi:hypothetical protein L0244_27240 [bacterium]|nr:hypothetical protein [bacterium]
MMKAYTLKLPEDKARALKHIAVEEDRTMREILEELIDQYIESHHETLQLLKIPDFYEKLIRSSEKARKGARGKKLNEMDR